MPEDQKHNDMKIQFWGWVLFVASAVLFILAGIRARDFVTIVASILFLLGCAVFMVPLVKAMNKTTTEELKAIARRWMEAGWQRGDPEIVDKLHAPHFVDHDSAGRNSDCEGFKQGIRQLYAGFPDFYAVTEDLVVDPVTMTVAVRWVATGSHQGTFMGIPATGKRITFRGIEIIRIEDKHIVERWGEWDGIDLLEQLGER